MESTRDLRYAIAMVGLSLPHHQAATFKYERTDKMLLIASKADRPKSTHHVNSYLMNEWRLSG